MKIAAIEPLPAKTASMLFEAEAFITSVNDKDLEKWMSVQSEPLLLLGFFQDRSQQSLRILETLRQHRLEIPLYLIAICEQIDLRKKAELLEQGADEVLTLEEASCFGSQRLSAVKRSLNERAALLESSQVLQRYAQHIDTIAAERARQLVHAERLSTLGTLSAGIAHEVKTPLAYMSASLETARIYLDNFDQTDEGPRVTEKIAACLERIEKGLEKVQALSNGLRKYSRDVKEEKTELSLTRCIEQGLELIEGSTRHGVELSLSLEARSDHILGNNQEIEQVVINLVLNACDALETQEEKKIIITMIEGSDSVGFSVSDNGPGIAEEKIESIFKPFFTTKGEEKGTGLGLAICRNIVESHAGTIHVRTKRGAGTTFEVRFPRLQREGIDRLPCSQELVRLQ